MKKLIGVLLATLFALIGSIPWIIIGYFGWVASIGGYIIGWSAYKGYVKGNGSFDRFGKICIALIIILIVPVAEMINLFVSGLQYVSLSDAIIYTPVIFFESISDFVPSILIGYFMAALGTYQFFLPEKKNKDITNV